MDLDEPEYEELGICATCARRESPSTCEAFGNGIPIAVLIGELDHHEPIDGDGGLMYEPITEQGGVPAKAALKLAADPRDPDEKRLRGALVRLFEKQSPDVARRIANNQPVSGDELAEALRVVVQPELTKTAADQIERVGAQVQIQMDPAIGNVAAANWAKQYSYGLVKDITDNTRTVIANAVDEFTRTPGMTMGDLRTQLSPAFSEQRARLIAITETTRAYSAATTISQEQLAKSGISMLRRWNTAGDRKVCVLCLPLDNTLETEWAEIAGKDVSGGPPRHPGCRCNDSLTLPPKPKVEKPAAPQAKPGTFQPLPSTAEVERWVREAYPDIQWDFTSAHIDTVNPTVSQLDRLLTGWMDEAKEIKYVGTYLSGASGQPAGTFAGEFAHYLGDRGAIGLNPKFYSDPAAFKKSLANCKTVGWLSDGDSIEAIVTHEFGHHIAQQWSRADKALAKVVRSSGAGMLEDAMNLWRQQHKPTAKLSKYALTNWSEGFAEGFRDLYHSNKSGWVAFVKAQRKFIDAVQDTMWLNKGEWTTLNSMPFGPDRDAARVDLDERWADFLMRAGLK